MKPAQESREGAIAKLREQTGDTLSLMAGGGVRAVHVAELIEVSGVNEVHARTTTMMLMVLLQNFHVLNCRSETRSLFGMPVRNNYLLFGAIVIAQSLHISAAFIPGLGETLKLEPITLNEWLTVLPMAASIVVVMEIFKLVWRKLDKRPA